jgi:lauroyl/myristoyl acyltransferase
MARTFKLIPLAFVAGPWGFIVFVPYLAAFALAAGIARIARNVRRRKSAARSVLQRALLPA